MVMPSLQKHGLLFSHLPQDRGDLAVPKINRMRQGYRIQPDLRFARTLPNMHVRRLTAITTPEEETVAMPP
jgi:hypothetical protein